MRFEKLTYPGKEHVYMNCYLHDSGLHLGQEEKRPAVVICPGGGYIYLSPREADPVALAYANKGFNTFILYYSLLEDARGFAPLKEMDWAIQQIRAHADDWKVAEDKIAVCGFSAGGHLALSSGLLGKEKPNAMILGYPAVRLKSERMDMLTRILGDDPSQPIPADTPWLDLSEQVTPDAPALFAFTTCDDYMTTDPTLDLVKAYRANGLKCEFHLFQDGPHGYSLANEAAADGSSQVLNAHVAKWLDLSADWLISTFGGLQFEDRSTSRIGEILKKRGIRMEGAENSHA